MNSAYLLIGAQLLGFWPVWRWYLQRVSDSSDEPWGVLALLTALVFTAICLRNRRNKDAEHNQMGLALSLAFTLVYILSFHFSPPLIRGILAMCALGSSLSAIAFKQAFHLGIVALLVLSLPLIASLQFYGGYPIRLLTAVLASKLVSISGYTVTADGTYLNWLGELISVDAPCAGIKMLWTSLYLAFTLACFHRLSNIGTWLSYTSATLAVFAGNVGRATVLFYGEAGILNYPTWAHSAIGLLALGLVSLCIASSSSLIARRFSCVA